MRIVEINSHNFASTGNIMLGIAQTAREQGHEVWTFGPAGGTQKKGIPGHDFIGNRYERHISNWLNYYTGKQSGLNIVGTYLFLKKLDKIKPDVIHLHNLHSNYINWEMLFHYIVRHEIKVVWTLHDCLPFTGRCPYFDIVQCEKWKTLCHDCPMVHEYPATKWDTSEKEYRRKKKLFTSVQNMIIVTPSKWLKELVEQSFLKEYPVKLIYNGIDLKKFYPHASKFREQYGLEDKFIVLGVAFSWGIRKGQDRFELIAEELDERFKMVLVGIEGKNIKSNKILCISRTDNQEQLAEIYSSANVLLNPTREDNFPTVNVEALACGLPVISYGAGGSAEAFDKESGMVVNDKNVIRALNVLYNTPFDKEKCIYRGSQFEKKEKFKEYVDLYKKLIN